MKKCIYLLIFAIITILPMNCNSFEEPHYVKLADNIVSKVNKRLLDKHNLRCCGIKTGMAGSVNLIGLQFQINRMLCKDAARAMIVDCVQELLNAINQDEKIRPYLQVYPFDAQHVEIVFYFSTHNYGDVFYPNLSVVDACNNEITYSTNDPADKYTALS